LREQSWWLLCVSEAKQGSKQAQVPSVVVRWCLYIFEICKVRWHFWVLARCTLPRSRSGVYSVYKFVRYLAVRRVPRFPPPPTLRVEDEDHGRSFSGYSARGCRFRFSFLSVFGPARAVRRPSTAPRRGGRGRGRTCTAIRITSRLRLASPSTGPGIARIRVWPYTGYACISYRHLSSVHGRLSHDGPSHF